MSRNYQSRKEGAMWVWKEWEEHGIGRTEKGPCGCTVVRRQTCSSDSILCLKVSPSVPLHTPTIAPSKYPCVTSNHYYTMYEPCSKMALLAQGC